MVKKKSIHTTKRVKFIRNELYINKRTGETEEVQVVSIEDRDANFYKIWLHHVITSLDLLGNAKTKFVFWLIEQMNSDNMITMTYTRMAKLSGFSRETVIRTIPVLIKNDFLTRIQNGVYRVNPNVIFKGDMTHRMNILLQYNTAKNGEE